MLHQKIRKQILIILTICLKEEDRRNVGNLNKIKTGWNVNLWRGKIVKIGED